MVLDHFAQYFLTPNSPAFLFCRIISRLTAPTMCFCIAQGYRYTHDVKKYLLRLGIFALISVIPFALYEYNVLELFNFADTQEAIHNATAIIYLSSVQKYFFIRITSVIFTLFLGLLAIVLWDKAKFPVIIKILFTIAILYLSCFGDWNYYIVLFCLIFYFLRNNKPMMWSAFLFVALLHIFGIKFDNLFTFTFNPKIKIFRLGILLVPLFLEYFYNGLPGKKSAFNKWFFYIFYPGHLLILYILKMLFC